MSATTRTRRTGFSILLGLFLGLILITAWEAASMHAGYDVTVETDSESGRGHQVRIRDGRWRLNIEYGGEIELTPDERALARLGPEAYFEIEERDRRGRRRFEATPGPGGKPEIVWLVDRQPAAFDGEAEAWLARVLKKFYRVTGHDAEGRVSRLLATGGVAGVLEETSEIGSDHVARIYFEHLLEQAEPSDQELARTLRQIARGIGSDHELRQLMQAIPVSAPGGEATADAWLAAARTIGSDHELRRTLSQFLDRPGLDDAGVETLLDAARDIGSDYELAELLRQLAAAHPIDGEVRPAFDRALATIGSEHQRERVLAAADG